MGGSYLGIDAHATTGLELAALSQPEGQVLWRDRCPLDGQRIRAALQRAPEPCTVVFEQGELATWLHLVLRGQCARILVADPAHNRLIATSPYKDDPFDAYTVAELAMGGYVHEVFQPPEAFVRLRLLVRHQQRLRDRTTRIKNQIKALYRQHGLVPQGDSVYISERQRWLELLPGLAKELVADHYRELDVTLATTRTHKARILSAAKRFPPAVRLCTIPEIGPLTAATFVAYVVTPERFPTCKQLWSYCGFGLMQRRSGSSAEPVRLRRDRNAHLKRVVKMAVVRICGRPRHPLGAAYRAKLATGTSPSNAMLTIGRRLINVMATLWSRQKDYDPDKITAAA